VPEGEAVSVQVDSSTWISYGRSPCPSYQLLNRRIWKRGIANVDDRVLAFDAQHKLLLFDVDIEILSFQISGYFNGDIKITDRLCPFVG
jgi:hypothetical protein